MRRLLMFTLAAMASRQAQAWPDDTQWAPIVQNGNQLNEPAQDQATLPAENASDMVGDGTYSAACWFADDSGLYLRQRLNKTPSSADEVRGALFETDGVDTDYEYLVVTWGLPTGFNVFQNTSPTGGVDDVAELMVTSGDTESGARTRLEMAGVANWGSSPEVLIDVFLSTSELDDWLGLAPTDCFRVAFATGSNLIHVNAMNADLAGHNDSTTLGELADGLSDSLCIDEDGDGLTYFVELEMGTNPSNADTDGDGLLDSEEHGVLYDPTDPDTDHDGVNDGAEYACGGADPDDHDGDGLTDATEGPGDLDGDGLPDFCDPDADGDGIGDDVETAYDSDGDGDGNYKDLDSDGDGIPDSVEGAGDTDHDGWPDYLDENSDSDAYSDAQEGTGDDDCDGAPNYVDPADDPGLCPDSGLPDTAEQADPSAGHYGGGCGGCQALPVGSVSLLPWWLLGLAIPLRRRQPAADAPPRMP